MQRLKSLGEDPPKSWTVTQLKVRYEELQTANHEAEGNDLQAALKEMKRANRGKKSEFLTFLQKEGITYGTTDTMVQLAAKAEQQITERHEVSGTEQMGFGKFGALTMKEVMEEYPSYGEWCRTTMLEEKNTSWRLRRFVQYIEKHRARQHFKEPQVNPDGMIREKANTKKTATTLKVTKAAQPDGYIKNPKNCIEDGSETSESGGSFAMVSASSAAGASETAEILRLQMELAAIREEKTDLELQVARQKTRKEM